MASDSEYPKVMKHLSTSNEAAGLDDTAALSRDALQAEEAGDVPEDTLVEDPQSDADDTISSSQSQTPNDDDDHSPIEGDEESPSDSDTGADTEEEPIESDIEEESSSTSEESPIGAHAARSTEPADDTPSEDSESGRATPYVPSHAAPKDVEPSSEAEDALEERPSPSHAASKEDDPVAPTTDEPTAAETAEAEAANNQDSGQAKAAKRLPDASQGSPQKGADSRRARSLDGAAYRKAAGTADPQVYGLEENEAERAMRLRREATQHRIRVGIVIASIAAAGWLLCSRPIAMMLKRSEGPRTEPVIAKIDPQDEDTTDEDVTETTDDADQEVAETETEVEEEPTPEEVAPYVLEDQLGIDDIARHVREHLTFDDNNVSVTLGDVSVEVSGGRVQVSHLTTDVTGVDPSIIAGRAAQRAAALSNDLTGHQIRATNDSVAAFSDVVWVVRDASGDSYLAVTFPVGSAPSSGDGLTVLAASPRYRLSDSLCGALGYTVRQEVGETPVGADGKYIWSTGVLPSPTSKN